MKIKQVRFQAFGQFVNQTFTLQPGLNVIQAPNESGKSTFLQGIYAILYGAAQEGLRIRREADWYAAYRPWLSEQYGGELDYQLGDVSYRLIRNLQKGREQEQLLNLQTGEELQHTFLLDQRKERRMVETQLGLSGELYRRIAYLTSYQPSGSINKKQEQVWQQKLMHKLSALVEHGDEVELTSIIRQLDIQIEEIGKTEQSKQRPLGILTHKQRQLSDTLEREQKLRDEGLQDQVELQVLLQEREKVEQQVQTVVEQQQRMSLALQGDVDWYQYEMLQQSFDNWQKKYAEHQVIDGKRQELDKQKHQTEPPFRMQLEDIEELTNLHHRHQDLIRLINDLEEQQTQQMLIVQEQDKSWWKPIYRKLTWSLFVLTAGLSFFSTVFIWMEGAIVILLWVLYRQKKKGIAKQEAEWKLYTGIEQLAIYQQSKEKNDAQLAWWTQRIGTTDVTTIRTWWKQTQAVEKIEWEIEQLALAQQVLDLEEGQSLQKQLFDCQNQMSYRYQGNCCFLVDQGLDINQLEQQREMLQNSIQQFSRQIGEKTKCIEELEDRIKVVGELYVVWEKVSSDLVEIWRKKEAMQIAKEMLQESYRKRRANISPILQQIASLWIEKVTNYRYDSLITDVADDSVSLSVQIPETGRKEKVDQLSTGTLMQMIFAFKMAIVQYISAKSSTMLPILLDDCFVYYDEERLSSILPLLSELAKSHQILLCTCHTREQEMLRQLGKPYHLVPLIC
jgi:hypothetical protein